MRTETEFFDADYRPFEVLKRAVEKREKDGWNVRQILQSNGTAWVVVFEREP